MRVHRFQFNQAHQLGSLGIDADSTGSFYLAFGGHGQAVQTCLHSYPVEFHGI
jgi:hypothetical protein